MLLVRDEVWGFEVGLVTTASAATSAFAVIRDLRESAEHAPVETKITI